MKVSGGWRLHRLFVEFVRAEIGLLISDEDGVEWKCRSDDVDFPERSC
jgi:hypothetical protein